MALFLNSSPLIYNIKNVFPRITSYTRCLPRVQVRLFSVNTKSAPFLKRSQRIAVTINRTFFGYFRKPNAEKLKQIDRIPEDYKLIYRNSIHRYLLSAQVFSTLSAVAACITFLVQSGWEFKVEVMTDHWKDEYKPIAVENEGLIYLASFVTLCVILQSMVMKMPIRIYNLPQREKYVFVFYGNMPFSKKKLVCKVNEVIKLEETGLLPWRDSRYEILNKRSIIMVENWFRRPADLGIMLGYQKPPEDYD